MQATQPAPSPRRIAALVLLCLLVLSGRTWADTVHLVDGGRHVGQVTRDGANYIVKTAAGKVTVHESDVLWVEQADRPEADVPVPLTPDRPASPEPAETTAPAPLGGDGLGELFEDPSSPSAAAAPTASDRPEPMVFHLMTALQSNATGATAAGLRHRLDVYRMAVKDRKRKVGVRWLEPKNFIAARESFLYGVNEARELAKDLRPDRNLSPRQEKRAERKQADAVSAKLRQAARHWLEPVMSQFFLGAAALIGEDYALAQRQFEGCIRQEPRIAAFHQGLGLALAGQDRHAEAAAAFVQALALSPDSRQGVEHLRQAVRDTRGSHMRDPDFLRAQALLRQYPDAGRSRRSARSATRRDDRIYWMLPGDEIYGRDMTLPIPEFDRLDVRQAVAVPVGESVLLVDRDVVEGALEVYVRLDDQTLIPAAVRRVRRSYRRGDDGPPLSLIYPAAVKLAPIAAGSEAVTLSAGQQVTAMALPTFAQAGESIVPLAMTADVSDPNAPALSAGLLPGSSAGPVMTADGRLAGFLSARANPFAENGGPSVFYGPPDLDDLLEDVSGRFEYRFARTKRDVRPKDLPGSAFIIYAIHGERFQD